MTERSAAETERVLLDNYPLIAPALLGAVVELLTVARHHCRDDLDRVLVLMVITLRTYLSPSYADLLSEQVLSGRVDPLPALGTNAVSIAESTGIPRETVRRKVNELISEGLVTKRNGHLALAASALPKLAEVRQAIIRFAAVAQGLAQACD